TGSNTQKLRSSISFGACAWAKEGTATLAHRTAAMAIRREKRAVFTGRLLIIIVGCRTPSGAGNTLVSCTDARGLGDRIRWLRCLPSRHFLLFGSNLLCDRQWWRHL